VSALRHPGAAPHLHAVVERPIRAPAFVPGVPPQPWPAFVRLCGESSDHDVALVVAQFARYGHGGLSPGSLEGLVADFPRITPGGLAAVDGVNTVHPSCCCGLESWRDWHRLLSDGPSPWLGHDPAPWVERRGDEFLVWADGGLGKEGVGELQPIHFSKDQLAAALDAAERDLVAFARRLLDWSSVVAPAHAQALAEGFRTLARLDSLE